MQNDGITNMSIIQKYYLNDECFTTQEWLKETPREVYLYTI